mmetsp:Transcript_16515/g.24092  ORF Transcript_16515/g.24092 Transcript_16515/m.24092 type:complete len:246 (-) Transcript_16515:340-1077(-)
MSPRSSNLVDIAIWSDPRVMTSGRMHGRNVNIFKDSDTLGSNCSSLGYRSMGDKVPDVMMTLPKRLKSGAMARDESKHASWMTGSVTPGMVVPFGSRMIANLGTPSEYVARRVAKSATSERALKSSRFDTCRVRRSEFRREYANLSALASRDVPFIIRWRKASGVSLCTPPFGPAMVRSLVFKCSTSFFIKPTKCFARLMFPGTAWSKTSGARTLLVKAASLAGVFNRPCSIKPLTKVLYSFRSR